MREDAMKHAKRLIAVLTALALVSFMPGVALASGTRAQCDEPVGQPTRLDLGVDRKVVFVGETVAVQGQLVAEAPQAPETPPGDDTSTAPLPGAVRALCEEPEPSLVPVPGVEVAILQAAPEGGWSQIATATTDADGAFSITVTVTGSTCFKAEFQGNDTFARARSCPVRVDVFANVTAPVATGKVVGGHAFGLSGRATRGAGAVVVTAYRVLRNGRLQKVASRSARISHGKYSTTMKLSAGDYRLVARQSGTSTVRGCSTKPAPLRVRRR
jgi:hypothetical protein